MCYVCNICGCVCISKKVERGDGRNVLFCADCGMGMVETPPENTSAFYTNDYYGQMVPGEAGYQDYAFTAEHSLLWAKLFIEALKPSGKILDIGCADGFLLRRLSGAYERHGIEVNEAAALQAAAHGIEIIANDITDPEIISGKFGQFDVISSIATFEHVLDLSRAFNTCFKILKPDGVLLFEIPIISMHRDNGDWFNSSYEHIYYPTISSIHRLLWLNNKICFTGFETDISGYGSTYIGAATPDPVTFVSIQRLLRATTQDQLDSLGIVETRLNLAYHVVHCFRPTPERVLALPNLLDIAATPNLLKRLTQLWYNDSFRAAQTGRQQ